MFSSRYNSRGYDINDIDNYNEIEYSKILKSTHKNIRIGTKNLEIESAKFTFECAIFYEINKPLHYKKIQILKSNIDFNFSALMLNYGRKILSKYPSLDFYHARGYDHIDLLEAVDFVERKNYNKNELNRFRIYFQLYDLETLSEEGRLKFINIIQKMYDFLNT